MQFENELREVRKITDGEFTALHRDMLAKAEYDAMELRFPDSRWRSFFLGAGEEKAVYCVSDHENRVFALELIDERTYLGGRLADGKYFFEGHASGVRNKKLNNLLLSGLVKAREFVHGYEWNRFRYDAARRRLIDPLLTFLLRNAFSKDFDRYRRQYKDVHCGNVMFELREAGGKGFPLLVKTLDGKRCWSKIGVRPIDVR
jgi:hypothetical protein